jgi:O-antigen/teichoic acid export membrane protein
VTSIRLISGPPPASEESARSVAESTPDILATSEAGPAAARGGALRVATYLLGALLSTGSAALLFRHLGRVDTGRYVTALALVAIIGAASDLGLTGVGLRELSVRPPDERWPLARDLLGLRLTLTVICGVLVSVIAWFAYGPTLGAGVALASAGLLVLVAQDNAALPLLIGLRLGSVSLLELLRQILSIAFIVLLVLVGAQLLPFFAISIPVGAIVLAATVALVRGTRPLAPTFNLARWRLFSRPMLPYTAAIAANAIYVRVSVVLMSALASAAQLGYFAVGYRVIDVLTLVPGLLVSSAFPIFAKAASDDHARLGYALGRVHEVGVIVGAWVAVSVAVGAPLAIEIVGGPKFKPAASVLAIQGIALGAMFVNLVWANGLLSLGLYRRILIISVSALIVNGVLVAALIPLDGARGAAIGTSVVELALCFVQAAAVVRGRPEITVPMKILPAVALATALGLLPLALAGTGVPVVARLVLSSVLFAGTLVVLRAVPQELLDLLPANRWARQPQAP